MLTGDTIALLTWIKTLQIVEHKHFIEGTFYRPISFPSFFAFLFIFCRNIVNGTVDPVFSWFSRINKFIRPALTSTSTSASTKISSTTSAMPSQHWILNKCLHHQSLPSTWVSSDNDRNMVMIFGFYVNISIHGIYLLLLDDGATKQFQLVSVQRAVSFSPASSSHCFLWLNLKLCWWGGQVQFLNP